MSKKVLIPWSGGMDSTALVIDALRRGYNVRVCNFEVGQTASAIAAESLAREAIRAVLDVSPNTPTEKLYVAKSHLEIDLSSTDCPFKQLPGWLFHLLTMLAPNKSDCVYDEIWLGYVMGDDASYTVGYLEQAWTPLVKALYGPEVTVPKLCFPLICARKQQIWNMLVRERVAELCWYCELPQYQDDKYVTCEYCPSCKRHEAMLQSIKDDREFNDRALQLTWGASHKTEESAPAGRTKGCVEDEVIEMIKLEDTQPYTV